MHSYQHNIKTFNNATRHLTRVERSLYRDLIELYYDSEKPLPADNFERLARLALANSDEEKAALRYVLSEFFTESNGLYVHDYCDVQIEKFYSNTTAKALAGKASAKARMEKKQQRQRERENENQTDVEQNSTGVERIPTNHKTSNHNKPITNLKDIAPQAAPPARAEDDKPKSKTLTHVDLVALGVDGQAAKDWLTARKAKKLPLTQAALDGVQREADKLGWTVVQAIHRAAEETWAGFKASWITNQNNQRGVASGNHRPTIDDTNTDWVKGIDQRVFDRARDGGATTEQGFERFEGGMPRLEGRNNNPSSLRLDATAVVDRFSGKQDFE